VKSKTNTQDNGQPLVISQKSSHALRALLLIASKGEGATVQISKIIRHEGIPKKSLQLIFLELKRMASS
jgi:DNA-binding IscR family transcriptional regulator